MKLDDFKATLSDAIPPDNVNVLLEALWYDAQEDWNTAHQLTQKDQSELGAWVHAYLHRKDGDINNAQYWYERAGKSNPKTSLSEEWEQIAAALTNKI